MRSGWPSIPITPAWGSDDLRQRSTSSSSATVRRSSPCPLRPRHHLLCLSLTPVTVSRWRARAAMTRETCAWPAVARGKRSRSRRESPSTLGSAASAGVRKEKKNARRGAPGSPASASVSGVSTSGGEDGEGHCSVVCRCASSRRRATASVEQLKKSQQISNFLFLLNSKMIL